MAEETLLVSAASAARMLGVHLNTFDRWVARGVIAPTVRRRVVKGQKRWFRRVDVLTLANSGGGVNVGETAGKGFAGR